MRRGLTLRRRAGKGALAVAMLLAGAACGGGGETAAPTSTAVGSGVGPEATGPPPTQVVLSLRDPVDTLDPHLSAGGDASRQLSALLYDTLVRRDSSGAVVAGAATRWEVSDLTSTFHLRSDLMCPEGDGSGATPFDASSVAASLRRLADPGTVAPRAAEVFGPAGVRAITADAAAGTVTIDLNQPYPELLGGLADEGALICPGGLADTAALSSRPSGSGPYLLGAVTGETFELRRNDRHTAEPPESEISALPDVVVVRVVADDVGAASGLGDGSTTIAAFRTAAGGASPTAASLGSTAAGQAPVEVVAGATGSNAVIVNHRPGSPGAATDFRVAVAQAIDSSALAAAAGEPTVRSLFTPNMECFDAAAGQSAPRFDPVASSQDLKSAGYRASAGGDRTAPDGSPFAVRVVDGLAPPAVLDALVAGLSAVDLGVVRVGGSSTEALAVLGAGTFDLAPVTLISTRTSPVLWAPRLTGPPSTTVNPGAISDPELSDLIAQASTAADGQRCTDWRAVEQRVLAAADVVPYSQAVTRWIGAGVTFDARYDRVDPFSIGSFSP